MTKLCISFAIIFKAQISIVNNNEQSNEYIKRKDYQKKDYNS